MIKIVEVSPDMKVVEIHSETGFRCCWENEKGRRWTSNFRYEYDPEYGYKSFTYNYINYEYDEITSRYYYLRESHNIRPEMDGALVRERIGKAAYMEIYGHLLEYLGITEKEAETTENCEECKILVKSSTYQTVYQVCSSATKEKHKFDSS